MRARGQGDLRAPSVSVSEVPAAAEDICTGNERELSLSVPLLRCNRDFLHLSLYTAVAHAPTDTLHGLDEEGLEIQLVALWMLLIFLPMSALHICKYRHTGTRIELQLLLQVPICQIEPHLQKFVPVSIL